MNAYSMDALMQMRNAVWATRDGCLDHYPRRCPEGCANAGKHDPDLAQLQACDCRECGFGVSDTNQEKQ